ncbi:type I-F CRISPR-associated endonuclease Cas1f [Desulfonatronovibrio hydrogenovorans]|uniref:type I-F CRISPR-associated endonuclease Cas1f n=1 Tax=Desulfonatronovibrio hydrogenovorans TaxID=53245 RepID=UPI00048FF04B|nr:type I-F CRISPR-associated endonuclease Cas1f [Desulfonatronovibrio hydrogenovorans]
MNMLAEKKHLKAILHSKRANIYYLEHCRVLVNSGRVEYLTQDQDKQAYWNIPIANTSVILLGTGTSITQAAVRMLSAAGVMLGFCGGGGSPLFAGTEVEWLSPQSEYRPTEYVQQWLSFWLDAGIRLEVAKKLQQRRVDNIRRIWEHEGLYQEYGLYADDPDMQRILERTGKEVIGAGDTQKLLQIEARATKGIYRYVATALDISDFTRKHEGGDRANDYLNHGNYLAYGLAATCLWVLGIPHGFPVMHGKTRRGALVFDVADLVKDALVLPTAFISDLRGDREQEFRDTIIDLFLSHKALDLMIDSVKAICSEYGRP